MVLALSLLAQGKNSQAAESYNELEQISSFGASLASTGLADLAIYEGRTSDAIVILEKSISIDLENERADIAADKLIMLAQAYLQQKKDTQARAATDRAVSTSKSEGILFSAAEIYIQTGQQNKARSLSAELSKQVQPESQALAKMIGGELSLDRGDIPAAINLFNEAQTLVDSWLGRFLLGNAYLGAEAYTEAYTEFDKCLKRRGEATSIFLNDLPSYHYFAPVYYYLGLSQEGLGSDAAAESFRKFLSIKQNGESSSQIEDAKKRLGSQ